MIIAIHISITGCL